MVDTTEWSHRHKLYPSQMSEILHLVQILANDSIHILKSMVANDMKHLIR